MTDFEHILPLWTELESTGADYVLATVVSVEGSSYRRPGACMLLAQDRRRAGTVSGGCLEAEVAKRAWWLTENGASLERYSTLEDDGDLPYGSGCGGVVYIFLERRATAGPLLHAVQGAFNAREPLAISVFLDGPCKGMRAFAGRSAPTTQHTVLQALASESLAARHSFERTVSIDGRPNRIWADYRPARPGLWIFGAGDDAKPLVRFARELGWYVVVADGRSHLATSARFPLAHRVLTLPILTLLDSSDPQVALLPSDAAVLVTHSFDQDTRILAFLLGATRSFEQAYIGVLGPQRRTREALAEAAALIGLAPEPDRIERWLSQVYAPTGIDLGADTPASIALSILAEIQQTLAAATARPLRQVRAAAPAVARQ